MVTGPPTPEPASPSKSPALIPPGTQLPRPSDPDSNNTEQIPATTSPGPIAEKQSHPEAEPSTSPSSTKTPVKPNVASPATRDRTLPRRKPASLHSMESRRSRSSSRGSNRSRRSSSSGSGNRAPRKAIFDPLSTIKSEASLHTFENDVDNDIPQLSLEPQLSWSTIRGSSSGYWAPSSTTVPLVRSVSPPTQVELDNHVRVFNELDLESMPPRKRSYTRHRFMTKERKVGLAFLAVAIPPLAVQRTIRGWCWREVSLTTMLWILGYIPGVVYAISVVMAPWQSIPESRDRKWVQRREEQEPQRKEDLRKWFKRLRGRDSGGDGSDTDEEDVETPRRRGWLLRRRFKHHSAPPPAQWTMGSVG